MIRLPETIDDVASIVGGRDAHQADPKAAVLAAIARLVGDGFADWTRLTNGDIELRFHSGEVFRLGRTTIIRVG